MPIFKIIDYCKNFLLDILFPYQCLDCHKEVNNNFPLCQECFSQITLFDSFLCPVCFQRLPPNKLQPHRSCRAKTNLSALAAAVDYNNPLIKEIIHHFKYENITTLKKPLGVLLFTLWQKNNVLLSTEWLIIPVPLHKKRKIQRGFNQAEILAKEFHSSTGFPLSTKILQRIINNPPQIQMVDWQQRQKNTKNIFKLSSESEKKLIKNKNIILIDDVFTTGATLEEAAHVLKQGGAKKIIGLVVAKG